MKNSLNLFLAILVTMLMFLCWQYFIERPKALEKVVKSQTKATTENASIKQQQANTEANVLKENNIDERVKFKNNKVSGSIKLKGLVFDDLILLNYKTDSKETNNVVLLKASGDKNSHTIELGWVSKNKELILPSKETIWHSDSNEIVPGKATVLSWKSPQDIIFNISISLDENYMFDIACSVINNSSMDIKLQNYGLIRKNLIFNSNASAVVHEGASGVYNSELKEISYKDLKEKKRFNNALSSVDWSGLSDKYWLSAVIPDKSFKYFTNFSYAIIDKQEQYQADFVSEESIIRAGETFSIEHHLFAGAKELNLLDEYEVSLNIKLFDRVVDFGWYYVLTKPMLNALHFCYIISGNFGLSIMIVTVIVKILMLGLNSKSFKSMKKMRELQPEMERFKKIYGDDKARLNQEVMALYKKHNVNPISGCLPILVQIPVFFSLYKVLNVSIEMRHAPFYGWIEDLSAADPTNIFNLFGLLPFMPPSFLHIGIWPLLMAGTMYYQQKLAPPATDPVQAQVMQFMPLIFLFMFSSLPAGLIIYWTWSNILSIAQQMYVNHNK